MLKIKLIKFISGVQIKRETYINILGIFFLTQGISSNESPIHFNSQILTKKGRATENLYMHWMVNGMKLWLSCHYTNIIMLKSLFVCLNALISGSTGPI